jgi:hypothetical protein
MWEIGSRRWAEFLIGSFYTIRLFISAVSVNHLDGLGFFLCG